MDAELCESSFLTLEPLNAAAAAALQARDNRFLVIRARGQLAIQMKLHHFLGQLCLSFGSRRSNSVVISGASNQQFVLEIEPLSAAVVLRDTSEDGTLVRAAGGRFKILRHASIALYEHAWLRTAAGHSFEIDIPGQISPRLLQKLAIFAQSLPRINRPLDPGPLFSAGNAQFLFSSHIACGESGSLYTCIRQSDGMTLAAKLMVHAMDEKTRVAAMREAHVLRRLKHPNIVEFVDALHHRLGSTLVTEFAAGGSLQAILDAPLGLSLPFLRSLIRQCLSALHHLHRLGVQHASIGPRFVLIRSLDPLRFKICGLHRARIASSSSSDLQDLALLGKVTLAKLQSYQHDDREEREEHLLGFDFLESLGGMDDASDAMDHPWLRGHPPAKRPRTDSCGLEAPCAKRRRLGGPEAQPSFFRGILNWLMAWV